MGKAKNRNAERISNGRKPKPTRTSNGDDQKPFIGNNVFTMEDHDIIKRIVSENPDTWTLQQIKNALPYTHTLKNIANYLLKLFPQNVIDAHANLRPLETETPADAQDVAPAVDKQKEALETQRKEFETKTEEEPNMNENNRRTAGNAIAADTDQMTLINQLISLCMQLSANADIGLHIKLENGMAINIEQNGLKGGN